jgi:YD repeat-containing protein
MPIQKGRSLYIALASLAVLLLLVGSASAAKVNYIYDELSRLIQVEYSDGTVIKYDYDQLGNRTYTEMLKNPFTLSITKAGVGSGIEPIVSSEPTGLDCGDFCESKFSSGPTVTLTVLPGSDYVLTGWSGGGCSGAGDCAVTMDGNKAVTATFALLPPVADFTASSTTVNETPVSFIDKSLRATSWYWEFGDGLTSTEQNPTHVYPSTGTYTVSLTITNSNSGLTSTKIRENYITVTLHNTCDVPMQPVQIDKTSVLPPVYYFSTLQEAYAAAAPGAVIKVEALTLLGDLIANENKSITLIGGYKCDYNEQIGKTVVLGSIKINNGSLDIGSVETFTGTSQIVYHQIYASSDAGGSISPSGTLNVVHGKSATYAIIPDQYYAIYKVFVDGVSVGAVDTYQFQSVTESHVIVAQFVKVELLPVADFTATPTTVGEISFAPVSFTDKSLRATTWYWEFGDGTTSTEQYPIHTYSIVSKYTVTLTVTNPTGTDTKTVANYITVRPYENIVVQIDKPFVQTFSSLQAAYDEAADGAVIKAVAGTLAGNLNANKDKSVTLAGGFQPDYLQKIGSTTLYGSITTTNGTLNISDMELSTGAAHVYHINASSGVDGSISPSGTLALAQGDNVTFTITPNQNYQIADVLVDDQSVGIQSAYTFINVTADHTIEAKFAQDAYTISIFAGSGGAISPSGIGNTVSVPYKSSQNFTITPDPGYHIADVRMDGSTVGVVTSSTFTNVTSDHFIEATFSDRYTLNVLKTGNGGGSIASSPAGIDCGTSCVNTLVSGSTITLTATPQSNSSFGGWSGGGCSGTAPCRVTLNSNTTVNGIFNLIAPPIANFSGEPTIGTKTLTVNFYDQPAGAIPTSWLWDFGDSHCLSSSNTSTYANPTHTYNFAGKYTVKLTEMNAGGSNTQIKTDFITVRPYVKIGTFGYNSIQEAYNAVQDGATATIQVLSSQALISEGREPLLEEDLIVNANKTITLDGGYEMNSAGEFLLSATGMTTMKGSITTTETAGKLTIKNIDLRK